MLKSNHISASGYQVNDPEELMRSRRSDPVALAVCILLVLLVTLPAYAYIDPNAAGLLSQILTPLLVAAAAGFTFFRKQVGAAFSGLARLLRRRSDV
ncbi:MAG TPA: hypothetical protein VE779_13760 [Candidatus Angelobacter sp.]|nr:hypothetical protein [Candidatus Angelobacter sp.]